MKKLVFLCIFIANSFVHAQESCSPLWVRPSLSFSTYGFELNTQNDPDKVMDQTLQLLQMTSKTLDESFDKKRTLEKGQLVLAQELSNGWSVELEYFVDRRGPQEVFRLGKMNIIKPNGERVAFEKKPTTTNGLEFSKNSYNEEELGIKEKSDKNPLAAAPEIMAPVVIQGALLQSFLEWAPRMSFLTRDDLKNVAQEKPIFRLRSKAFVRSNLKYAGGIIKKQSFKFVLMGLAMYLYISEKDKVLDYVSNHSDPWDHIIKKTGFRDASQDFVRLTGRTAAALGLNDDARKGNESPGLEVSKALREVHSLYKHEYAEKGIPHIYWADKNSLREVSMKSLGNSLKNVSDSGTNYLVAYFPETKRILLLTPTSDDSPRLEMIGLDPESAPKIYNAVESTLKSAPSVSN